MSVQTQIERIAGEVATQSGLIERIEQELNSKGGSVTLPTLSNAATPNDILFGMQMLDGAGNIITGTIESQAGGVYAPDTTDLRIETANKYIQTDIVVPGYNRNNWEERLF